MRIGTIVCEGRPVGTIDLRVTVGAAGIVPSFAPDSFGFHGFPDSDTDEDLTPHGYGPMYEPNEQNPDGRNRAEKVEKGPTFRRGIGPGSVNYPREHLGGKSPPRISLGDVKSALQGGGRARFREELIRNPGLRDKVLALAAAEQGTHGRGTTAIIESMMNRAVVRGTSLEAQARWTSERGGYYDHKHGGPRRGWGAVRHAGSRALLEASLERALGGSNEADYATDNSSGPYAAGERRTGKFRYRTWIHGETFFAPGWKEPKWSRKWDEWMARGAPGGPGASADITHYVPIEKHHPHARQTVPAPEPRKEPIPARPEPKPKPEIVKPKEREVPLPRRRPSEPAHAVERVPLPRPRPKAVQEEVPTPRPRPTHEPTPQPTTTEPPQKPKIVSGPEPPRPSAETESTFAARPVQADEKEEPTFAKQPVKQAPESTFAKIAQKPGVEPTFAKLSPKPKEPEKQTTQSVEPTFANQARRTVIERDRSGDTFSDRPYQSRHVATTDLEYLQQHGAHSTTREGGRNVNGPPGAAMGANPDFVRRMAAAGRAYTAETGREPNFSEMDRTHEVQRGYWERYVRSGRNPAYIAAREGHSRHEGGEAMDIPRGHFLDWMHAHSRDYGINFPVWEGHHIDYPHAQLMRGVRVPADTAARRNITTAPVTPPARPPLPARPTATTTPAARQSSGGTLLFLHGMNYERFGNAAAHRARIEADMAEVANARHMTLEVIPVMGEHKAEQIKAAQDRINRGHGDIGSVYGFSQGGYATKYLHGVPERVAFGAPKGVPWNLDLPGPHMYLSGALRDRMKMSRPPQSNEPFKFSDFPTRPDVPALPPFHKSGPPELDWPRASSRTDAGPMGRALGQSQVHRAAGVGKIWPAPPSQETFWEDVHSHYKPISHIGSHANWPKFEREARLSLNVEDWRARILAEDPRVVYRRFFPAGQTLARREAAQAQRYPTAIQRTPSPEMTAPTPPPFRGIAGPSLPRPARPPGGGQMPPEYRPDRVPPPTKPARPTTTHPAPRPPAPARPTPPFRGIAKP